MKHFSTAKNVIFAICMTALSWSGHAQVMVLVDSVDVYTSFEGGVRQVKYDSTVDLPMMFYFNPNANNGLGETVSFIIGNSKNTIVRNRFVSKSDNGNGNVVYTFYKDKPNETRLFEVNLIERKMSLWIFNENGTRNFDYIFQNWINL